ncbi:MAG: DUF2652 domain-containing protein [Flavisolibacter sp.]|jgi:hypothetical protein|nr:DUF2652 domain-containing protein [Flavisolibacter sp.]
MAGSPTTILIPDISGFTEFVTNTELSHSSFAISMLINTIIDAVKDEYEISEIEGDAVLMFKRGPAPSQKEIQDTCLKIFNAFHFQRKWMQQHAVCPCKACNQITHLTLKFVAHHGSIGEIKAGGFTKLSGTDVIVAHRLLKNSVPSHEYLLLTEKLLQHSDESPDAGMEWFNSSESYPSIGEVEYRFALLNEKRKTTPEPPKPQHDYPKEATAYFEIPIAANYREAYMVLMNIPNHPEWLPGLQNVEQDIPAVFVGSIHYCTFNDYQATISPIQMTVTEEEITYVESCKIEEMDISLVHEFIFRKVNEAACIFSWRFLNAGKTQIQDEEKNVLLERMQQRAKSLKEYCEKMEVSAF